MEMNRAADGSGTDDGRPVGDNDALLLRILDRMRMQCARREYCETDIRKKIARELGPGQCPGIASDIVDRIIASLKSDGYIDDFRYSRAFARDKSSISGWGRLKIRHSLAAKGIDRDCIASAMDEIEDGAGMEKLEKALEARAKKLKDDPYRKFRLLKFALSRGFSYDEVSDMVDKVLEEN